MLLLRKEALYGCCIVTVDIYRYILTYFGHLGARELGVWNGT